MASRARPCRPGSITGCRKTTSATWSTSFAVSISKRNRGLFMPEQIKAAEPPAVSAGRGTLVHADTTAKWFLISSICYFFIVGVIAVTIAAKFVWPSLLGSVQYLTYGRLRPLHVNGMLFGWLLAADMGLTFFLVPRLCGVRLW